MKALNTIGILTALVLSAAVHAQAPSTSPTPPAPTVGSDSKMAPKTTEEKPMKKAKKVANTKKASRKSEVEHAEMKPSTEEKKN